MVSHFTRTTHTLAGSSTILVPPPTDLLPGNFSRRSKKLGLGLTAVAVHHVQPWSWSLTKDGIIDEPTGVLGSNLLKEHSFFFSEPFDPSGRHRSLEWRRVASPAEFLEDRL